MRKTFARRTRIYSTHKYNRNPLFQSNRRRVRRFSTKTKVIAATVFILLVGCGWFLAFHPFFSIHNVVIEGSNIIPEYKLYELVDQQRGRGRWWLFSQNNIFIFSKKQLRRAIVERYYVTSLSIKKRISRTLVIRFQEAAPAAVWLEDDIYYYIDENVNVISKAENFDPTTTAFIMLKNSKTGQGIIEKTEGRKIAIEPAVVAFAKNLEQKANTLATPHERLMLVNNDELTVSLKLTGGPWLHFNIKNNLDDQFNNVVTLLNEKLKGEELSRTQYIDVRFGEKIYYK